MMGYGKKLTKGRMSAFVSTSAVSLFIISGRMVYVSREYTRGEWRGAAGASVIALMLAAIILPLIAIASDSIFSKGVRARGRERVIGVLFSAVGVTAAIYVAMIGIEDIALFVNNVMLLKIEKITIGIAVLLLGAYMSLSGGDSIKKYGAVALAFGMISAVVLFLISISRGGVRIENLGALFTKEALREMTSPTAILEAFFSGFAPATIALIWLSASQREGEPERSACKRAWVGLIGGVAVLAVCFLNTALLLGLPFSAEQEYPYASAIGSITAGKLFMRPEGLVYLSYLSAAIVRVAVCISLISLLFEKTAPSRNKRRDGALLSFGASAVIFVAYVFVFCV